MSGLYRELGVVDDEVGYEDLPSWARDVEGLLEQWLSKNPKNQVLYSRQREASQGTAKARQGVAGAENARGEGENDNIKN